MLACGLEQVGFYNMSIGKRGQAGRLGLAVRSDGQLWSWLRLGGHLLASSTGGRFRSRARPDPSPEIWPFGIWPDMSHHS